MTASTVTHPTRRSSLCALLGAGAGLLLTPIAASAQDEYERARLKGAGSTFVAPLVASWVQAYQHRGAGGIAFRAPNTGLDDDMNGVALDYEPVGSLAGIQRVRSGAVDFALSEMPLPSAELRRYRLLQIPLTLGSVAIAANVQGVPPGAIRLSGSVIADIYLGKVRRWNDAAIQGLNPDLRLPDADIKTLHRSDGSGTTFTLTSYLGAMSGEWRQRVGAESLVKWPPGAGAGAKGSRGMVDAVRSTPNSLGYIDEVQARKAQLSMVAVQNASGKFIAPSSAATLAAGSSAAWDPQADFYEVLVNSNGLDAYPIVASMFGLMSDRLRLARNQRTLAFFDWALADGQRSAETLGYVPLPPAVSAKVRSALASRSSGA